MGEKRKEGRIGERLAEGRMAETHERNDETQGKNGTNVTNFDQKQHLVSLQSFLF